MLETMRVHVAWSYVALKTANQLFIGQHSLLPEHHLGFIH